MDQHVGQVAPHLPPPLWAVRQHTVYIVGEAVGEVFVYHLGTFTRTVQSGRFQSNYCNFREVLLAISKVLGAVEGVYKNSQVSLGRNNWGSFRKVRLGT